MLYLFHGNKASNESRDEMVYVFGSHTIWCMGDQTDFNSLKVAFSETSFI